MKKLLPILILLAGCTNHPRTTGAFFVRNENSETLLIRAERNGAPLVLMDSLISPGEESEIFRASDFSGGNVYPENVFSRFQVFEASNPGNLLYEGVENTAWQIENGNPVRNTLVIP